MYIMAEESLMLLFQFSISVAF